MLTSADTAKIIEQYGKNAQDSGSCESQVALWSARISYLTDHLKANVKDFHTRYGLQNLVSRRRRLLKYLKRTDIGRYRSLVEKLGLRDSN